MIRRDFMKSASTAALAGLVPRTWSYAKDSHTRGLVDTPEKRSRYLKTMLKRLCTDIGPHPTGTPEFKRAATIIGNDLKAGIPMTDCDRFPIEKWKLVGKPEFFIGDTSIETLSSSPRPGKTGTSPEGVRGIIKKIGDSGYVIADPSTGETLANISISAYGRAIPGASELKIVGFGIGKQDVPLLEAAASNKTPVRAVARAVYVPNAVGINVVATIPGQTNREILFLAHADTVYSSPGANDNTASMIAMLMMAHFFSGAKPKYTLRFIATDGEEYGLLGAAHYAEQCKKEGTLGNIAFITNFDSLTYGPNLWYTTLDSGLKEIFQSIHTDLKIEGIPRFSEENGFILDNAPFLESGARAVDVNSRGYDEETLPLYHRPEDTADTVHENCVENSFLVFTEYVRRIITEL